MEEQKSYEVLKVEESKVEHIARTAKADQKKRKERKAEPKLDDWYEVNMNKIIYKSRNIDGSVSSDYVGKTTQDPAFYQKILSEGKVRARKF